MWSTKNSSCNEFVCRLARIKIRIFTRHERPTPASLSSAQISLSVYGISTYPHDTLHSYTDVILKFFSPKSWDISLLEGTWVYRKISFHPHAYISLPKRSLLFVHIPRYFLSLFFALFLLSCRFTFPSLWRRCRRKVYKGLEVGNRFLLISQCDRRKCCKTIKRLNSPSFIFVRP